MEFRCAISSSGLLQVSGGRIKSSDWGRGGCFGGGGGIVEGSGEGVSNDGSGYQIEVPLPLCSSPSIVELP